MYNQVYELMARSVLGLVHWMQMDPKKLGLLASQLRVIRQGEEVTSARMAHSLKALVDLEQATIRQMEAETEGDGSGGQLIN